MKEEFGICHLSIVPVRAEPSDKSEQVTQLLFGEHFEILEHSEKWVRLRISYDQYEGWIDRKQFKAISEQEFERLRNTDYWLSLDVVNPAEKSNKENINLVIGSTLPFFDGLHFKLGEEQYTYFGKSARVQTKILPERLEEIAFSFLNAPYLWGGRSPFGIDCSGFTQVVFKMMGVALKRDAWQQAEQGSLVNFFEETILGDLAFFDNEEGRITHVGLVLPGGRIIHASGRVRVDVFDHQGIFNTEAKKYSHKLRIIRRVL